VADGDGIRIDFDDIMRGLAANRFDSVQVEFVPDPGRSADELIAALRAAVGTADDTEAETWGEDPVVTLAGGSVQIKEYWSEESLRAWLAVLARELRAAGFGGLVHATPTVAQPRWLRDAAGLRMTAFVAHDGAFEAPVSGSEETGAAAVAAWCRAAADWTAGSPGASYLTVRGMSQVAPAEDVGVHLARAARAGAIATITRAQQQPGQVARASFQPDGYTIYQVYDAAVPVLALVDRVRRALLIGTERMRLGFVAPVPVWAYGWIEREKARPPLPTVPGSALRANSPLWTRYVPDAHGMQVLTDEHLRHAADLSTWTVTQLGPGRHLVEAANLADWYGPDGPSDSVVRRARADFGDVIVPAGALP
jgi:hypothetical protein